MKEFKFRYVFKNKFFGDFSFYHLTLKQIEEGVLTKILKSGMKENGYELVSRDRYTELKDKNGREIYEKDIVIKNEYPFYSKGLRNYVGIIEWFDEDLCWSYSITTVSDRVRGCACGASLNKNDKFEVIGNLHENPELLKEEKWKRLNLGH